MISLAVFEGCADIPKPVGDICSINAFEKPEKRKKCYRMETDFDDRGQRKPNAKATFKSLNSIQELNGHVIFDPDSFAEVRIFGGRVREKLQQCQQQELHDARTLSRTPIEVY